MEPKSCFPDRYVRPHLIPKLPSALSNQVFHHHPPAPPSPPLMHHGEPQILTQNVLFQQLKHKSQLDDLSKKLGSLQVDGSENSPNSSRSSVGSFNSNKSSSDDSMEDEDDSNSYFQNDPYCQKQRRTDPVYASMASHLAPTCPDMNYADTNMALIKRPDVINRCSMNWL